MARPLPRPLRRARHSLALRWLLVAVAAGFAAVETARLDDAAAASRDAWGRTVAVAVATRDLAAGEVVGDGDVRVEARPAAVVPAGAPAEPPLGRVVTAGVLAGEVLAAARVAPDGLRGAAALVPEGWRALAVPVAPSGLGGPAPPLAVGDRVDLLAPEVVAAGAVVVAVAEGAVTVAVPAEEADDVAEAVVGAAVTLALRGA